MTVNVEENSADETPPKSTTPPPDSNRKSSAYLLKDSESSEQKPELHNETSEKEKFLENGGNVKEERENGTKDN